MDPRVKHDAGAGRLGGLEARSASGDKRGPVVERSGWSLFTFRPFAAGMP